MKKTKAERILAMLEKGYSINTIAHSVQCTKRYVYMLSRQRKKAAQLQAEKIREWQIKHKHIETSAPPVSLWQRIKNFFKG